MYKVLVLLVVLACGIRANLIENGDFDSNDASVLGPWVGNGGEIAIYSGDSHVGPSSLRAYDRLLSDEGPCQFVPVHRGKYYRFKAYARQLNDLPIHVYQTFMVTVKYYVKDYDTVTPIVKQPYAHSKSGWFDMEGIFHARDSAFKKVELCINGPDAGVEFLLDDVSLEEFREDSQWLSETDSRINSIRKNKIHFIFTLDSGIHPSDIDIKVDHKRHLFGFGMHVDANWFNNQPQYSGYQNMTFNLFNGATIAGFSWPYREMDLTKFYDIKLAAAKILQAHGLKVTGTEMFGRGPSLVRHMNTTELKQAMHKRMEDMFNITSGLVDFWDVRDDPLNQLSYEEQTADTFFSQQMFQMMKGVDSSTKHFMSEKDVIADGTQTHAYTKLISVLKNSGLDGVGAHGYFPMLPPDPQLVQMRLDKLASIGLPIWITDLGVSHVDNTIRADLYEMALRIFFSHPLVEGVTLKNAWSSTDISPYMSIANGFDYQLNEAGRRYEHLVKTLWSTHVTKKLDTDLSFTVDGFHGDYEISVLNKGIPVLHSEMKLGKTDQVFKMHISLSKESPHNSTHASSSVNLIGRAVSGSNEQNLRAVTLKRSDE